MFKAIFKHFGLKQMEYEFEYITLAKKIFTKYKIALKHLGLRFRDENSTNN